MTRRFEPADCEVPGGRVRYEILNPDAPAMPVVVVHGGPGTPHDYLRPLGDLLPEHPVLVYDQLGCGRSQRPAAGYAWDLPRFVDELYAVITDAGLDELHLVAHSFGTMIATDAALRGDPRLRGLVLVSPTLDVHRHEQEMQQLLLSLPTEVAADIAAAVRGRPTPGTPEAMMRFAERHMCRLEPWPDILVDAGEPNTELRDALWGPTDFHVSGALRGYRRTARLGEIENCSLLVCGRFDFATPRLCERYAKALRNAKLSVIEGASHMTHLEAPGRFGQVMHEFFGSFH